MLRHFMTPRLLVRLFLAAAATLLCVSCAEMNQPVAGARSEQMKTAMAAPAPKPAYWDDVAGKGRAKIVVKLEEQRAYFYRGKVIVGESNISTGRKGFETPPGKYAVIQKDEHHASNLYGDYVDPAGNVVKANVDTSKESAPEGATFRGAPMKYFLRFTGGYGMHAGFVPRYRASHGCIRMPSEMAQHFFTAADNGTPVIVE